MKGRQHMHRRSFMRRIVEVVMAGGLPLFLAGCFGIPKGTTKLFSAGTLRLQAKGAGLVRADPEKTTFKIKCARCGFEGNEVTIPTPTLGRPYSQEWVCPRCGHKQQIIISVTDQ